MVHDFLEEYIQLYLCDLLMTVADDYNINYYLLIKYLDYDIYTYSNI